MIHRLAGGDGTAAAKLLLGFVHPGVIGHGLQGRAICRELQAQSRVDAVLAASCISSVAPV